MIWRCFVVLALLITPAAPAWAETVRVRSGEHGAFTRVVLDLPRAGTWQLSQTGRQVDLRLDAGVTGFDLSGVFEKIDRSRLAAIRPGPTRDALVLDLACACDAEALLVGSRMLAIDITPAAEAPAPSPRGLSFGDLSSRTRTVELPLFLPPVQKKTALPPVNEPAMDEATDIAVAKAVSNAEKRLLRQLGRAATQGLLTPVAPTPKPVPPTSRIVEIPAPVRIEPKADDVPLRATTSQDAGFMKNLRVNGQSIQGAACLPDDAFAVPDWGGEGFDIGLANWRAQLFGEFDKANPAASLGLARHYIHYGFGAEARQALALTAQAQPILHILSRVVDGDPVDDAGPLPAQTSCEGAVALWAVLALPDNAPPADVNDSAVIRHFAALPEHLRDRLGPGLAQRLAQAGYDDAADIVLRRLNLSSDRKTAQHALAEAEIERNRGDAEKAQETRKQVVAENAAESPLALAKIIEDEIAAGRSIPRKTAELAAAFAFENRGGENGPLLGWADSLAHAGAGQFDAAFDKLDALSPENPHADPDAIFDLLLRTTADAEFIKHLFGRIEQAAGLAPDLANRLARRALELGFPDQAAEMLTAPATGTAVRERRLLRAEVALALSRPRQAEAELLGHSGPDVDALRARARSMAGDHAVAAQVFSSLEADDETLRAAFLAGEWEQLADSDDPVLAALARLKLADTEASETLPGVLARNRALLEQSSDIRSTLDQLLSSFSVDETGG